MENVPAPQNPHEIVPYHPEIEQALRDGHQLHGFRSGGGLRVISIENSAGETVAYGEAPHIEDALEHASVDYTLGHESYEKQYSGDSARHDHYLTGAAEASSPLDGEMLGGMKIDARRDPRNNDIAAALSGTKFGPEIPDGLQDYVTSTGNAAQFVHRTITYEATPIRFASGDIGMTTRVVANPNNLSTTVYDYAKIAAAPTFAEAVAAAFVAPEVEIGGEQ